MLDLNKIFTARKHSWDAQNSDTKKQHCFFLFPYTPLTLELSEQIDGQVVFQIGTLFLGESEGQGAYTSITHFFYATHFDYLQVCLQVK